MIPDKINNFINLTIEQYRALIKEEIDNEYELFCQNILSDNNINIQIKDIVEMINKSMFLEEINFKIVKDVDKIWDKIYMNNKLILDYFKETKINVFNN